QAVQQASEGDGAVLERAWDRGDAGPAGLVYLAGRTVGAALGLPPGLRRSRLKCHAPPVRGRVGAGGGVDSWPAVCVNRDAMALAPSQNEGPLPEPCDEAHRTCVGDVGIGSRGPR